MRVFNRTVIIVSPSSSATKHRRAWTAHTKLTEPRGVPSSCRATYVVVVSGNKFPKINIELRIISQRKTSITMSRIQSRASCFRCWLAGEAWETFEVVAWPGRVGPSVSAMAASPNSATRSHSSSVATPDAIFDEPIDNIGCTHISPLLADTTERDPLLKRFRRVVTWKAQRTHEALHSAKRRKVCYS